MMKRLQISLILLTAGVWFTACIVQSDTPHYTNKAQRELDSIITHYHKVSTSEFNAIVLDELFDEYHEQLKTRLTQAPIQEWEAQLQALKTSDIKVNDVAYKHITFDLINGLNAVPKITFHATYDVKADSVQHDALYQQLKGIGNLQQVVFSGTIQTGRDQSVLTVYESLGTSYLMTYPDFQIRISDIKPIERP